MTDFKDLDTTMKTTDSGQVSGGSSIGSHSPPNMEANTVLMPPPRYILPSKLKPSPGVKMHPSMVPSHFKGKLKASMFFFTANGGLELAVSLWQAHVQVQIRLQLSLMPLPEKLLKVAFN